MRRIALSCVLAFMLSSCSALGGSSESSQSSSGGLEQTKVTVGTLPIVDTVPLAIAQEKGYFKQEGLEVEVKSLPGGAAAVPGLANGELQFAFGNYVSFFTAQAKGVLDIKLVADAYQATQGMFLIMTGKGSEVGKPLGLAGKKIAINTKSNIVELTARSSLEAAGVDPKTVTFTEIPFPDMQAALERNNVDAAFMVEPYITQSERSAGMVPVLDAATGATQDVPIAAWATSAKFAQASPKTTAAFQRAIVKGQRDAADRRLVEQTVPTYAKVDKDTASLMNLGSWPTSLSAVRMQRVIDLMKKYGVLDKPIDPAAMIFAGPAPF
ncbi:NitT/TauT family transport system substrate-binding protein [Kibdelosporangium banguiense]|uniref:NitT/TauT family transport system substrate-binding protein n=1 Tax=Kibdelosporangium banguiense TaxID=1365924 RepID=A0ABS4TLE7_9PSEU|nr:ABC transporter substrate-binding protein [Kibdelosporangium banguiense]MBP2325215.1 NitT/TauT family transport system substrate-binding protein [Kibdelosporangium banguiense]